jgi:hypothetical protein
MYSYYHHSIKQKPENDKNDKQINDEKRLINSNFIPNFSTTLPYCDSVFINMFIALGRSFLIKYDRSIYQINVNNHLTALSLFCPKFFAKNDQNKNSQNNLDGSNQGNDNTRNINEFGPINNVNNTLPGQKFTFKPNNPNEHIGDKNNDKKLNKNTQNSADNGIIFSPSHVFNLLYNSSLFPQNYNHDNIRLIDKNDKSDKNDQNNPKLPPTPPITPTLTATFTSIENIELLLKYGYIHYLLLYSNVMNNFYKNYKTLLSGINCHNFPSNNQNPTLNNQNPPPNTHTTQSNPTNTKLSGVSQQGHNVAKREHDCDDNLRSFYSSKMIRNCSSWLLLILLHFLLFILFFYRNSNIYNFFPYFSLTISQSNTLPLLLTKPTTHVDMINNSVMGIDQINTTTIHVVNLIPSIFTEILKFVTKRLFFNVPSCANLLILCKFISNEIFTYFLTNSFFTPTTIINIIDVLVYYLYLQPIVDIIKFWGEFAESTLTYFLFIFFICCYFGLFFVIIWFIIFLITKYDTSPDLNYMQSIEYINSNNGGNVNNMNNNNENNLNNLNNLNNSNNSNKKNVKKSTNLNLFDENNDKYSRKKLRVNTFFHANINPFTMFHEHLDRWLYPNIIIPTSFTHTHVLTSIISRNDYFDSFLLNQRNNQQNNLNFFQNQTDHYSPNNSPYSTSLTTLPQGSGTVFFPQQLVQLQLSMAESTMDFSERFGGNKGDQNDGKNDEKINFQASNFNLLNYSVGLSNDDSTPWYQLGNYIPAQGIMLDGNNRDKNNDKNNPQTRVSTQSTNLYQYIPQLIPQYQAMVFRYCSSLLILNIKPKFFTISPPVFAQFFCQKNNEIFDQNNNQSNNLLNNFDDSVDNISTNNGINGVQNVQQGNPLKNKLAALQKRKK